MTKRILLLWALMVTAGANLYAQKEIWGSASGGQLSGHTYGYIYKTDSTGNNLTIVHEFDSIHGMHPGELTLGSNGKLYGTTSGGGSGHYLMPNGSPGQTTYGGVLFEYDPILDSLRILHQFDIANAAFPYDWPTEFRLLEVSPGVFYGTCVYYGRVLYKYTVATNTLSLVTMVPNFNGGAMNTPQANYMFGPLVKASNGMVYGATIFNSACPIGFPLAGTLVRLNPANNTLTTVYPNPCSTVNGTNYSSPTLEHNGKLYSVARGGDFGAGTTFMYPGYGVVYEFNPANNAYTKKASFTGGAGGRDPHMMLKGDNGKFYGAAGGGTPYFGGGTNHPNGSGILYEFDPVTNAITPKHEFRAGTSISDEGEYGTLTLKASNGKFYGNTTTRIYSYDPVLDSVQPGASLFLYENPKNLVEICRKPEYTYNPVTQYTVCTGSFFQFDPHNGNATSVVWKHNTIIDATQTSPILQFGAITAAQAGTWSCTLTNACGSTTLPNISITVNAAGAGTVTSTISPAGPQLICPGSSITLSGNSGGHWNTGATTPTLTVNTPGTYQVTNTNACGNTYSNLITVDTIPSPAHPVAAGGNTYACPGGSWTLYGNSNGGTWSNGATTDSITVPVVPGNSYYIINTHTCGTDTSNIIPMEAYVLYDTTFIPLQANGPLRFCEGGSITLHPSGTPNTWANYTWYRLENTGYLTYLTSTTNPFTITESGTYVFRQSIFPCGLNRDDTVTVTVDTLPPTPVITALGATTFCEGGSVVLQSNIPNTQWNTGETATSITVTQAGTYTTGINNTCGSTTSAGVTISTIPAPAVSYTAPITEACTGNNTFQLTGGTPAGGSYSGPGVSGGQYFTPASAGTGTHTITYTYTDGTCPASATQQVHVVAPQQPLLLANHANNTFCQGGNMLLFQTQYPVVQWSTGDAGPVLLINQPGTYSYTVTDACGTVTSNSITAVMNPTSASNNPQTICAGETYTFNGHQYTSTGSYTDVFTNVYGCDSTITTVLTVTPPPNSNNPQTICAGSSYIFNGHTYTTAGNHIDIFQSSNGCDSTVTTQLTVTPAPTGNNPQTICAGETYTYNGHVYSAAGNYADTLHTGGGCDSIVTTQLTVLPAPHLNNTQSICAGESYTLNGHTYTGTGTYTDTFTTAAGCDSTITTHLTVHDVDVTVTQTGNLLTALQTAATYQWINCATQTPIPGATAQTYTATANGSYAVVVSANNCSDTSACNTVNTVAIQEWNTEAEILLYPNPATDVVWLKSSQPIEHVRVYNTVGQCVYTTQNSNKLDIAGLAPGTYFVTATTQHGLWKGKFVKM